MDLNEELIKLKIDNGFIDLVECTKEEAKTYQQMDEDNIKLPIGIIHSIKDLKYYKCVEKGISVEEMQQICNLRNTSYMKTTKNYAKKIASLLVLLIIIHIFIILLLMP